VNIQTKNNNFVISFYFTLNSTTTKNRFIDLTSNWIIKIENLLYEFLETLFSYSDLNGSLVSSPKLIIWNVKNLHFRLLLSKLTIENLLV